MPPPPPTTTMMRWMGVEKPRPCWPWWILDNCKLSYDSYAFPNLKPLRATPPQLLNPENIYPDEAQVQRALLSPPDAAGRSAESSNKFNRHIPVWYVLLDNQSTVGIFSDASLLTNIRHAWQTIWLSCNSGTAPITLVKDIEGYGTVWFHPEGIANIL